jgi:hypothetical protein
MKLRNHQFSTQPRIFDGGYEHPWYKYLNKPNPPTQEAVEKAKFKDKTFHWDGGVRSRNKRTSK